MDCECKSVFNRLSAPDRLKLRSAAATKAIAGFIRDDTAAHPERYPFYMLYLVSITTPLPFPFFSWLAIGATLAWAKYSKSEYAARFNGRLKQAFDPAAMVCDHKEFITPHPEKSDALFIKNGALAWDTTKKAAAHTWQSTRHAFGALQRMIFS